MAYYIKEDEKIHIITEMSTKKMAWELSQMFYSREEFNSDDIFFLRFQCPYKFYLDVFKHLYFFTIKQLDRGKIDEVLMSVFSKLIIDEYPLKCDKKEYPNPDYIVSRFLESVLLYVMREYGNYNIACQIIATVCTADDCNPSVIKEIVIRNRELLTLDIIRDIIKGEILTSDDIIDILIEMNKYYDNDTIDDTISDLYFNKDLLLSFTKSVMRRFRITVDEKRMKNGKILIKEVVKPIYRNANEKELLLHLREYLSEIIYSSAELEMFEFISNTFTQYMADGNKYLSDLYNEYLQWLGSKERDENKSKNFHKYGYEEGDFWYEDAYDELATNIFIKGYIIEIDKLSDFDLFIRVFNVNRFKLFQYKNIIPISYRVSFASEYSEWYVDNGLDISMYLFLNLNK